MSNIDNTALGLAAAASRKLEEIQNLIDSGEIGGSITVPDTNFFASNTERNTYFTNNPSQLVDGVYCAVASQLQQYRVNAWVDISTTIRGPKGDKGDKGDIGEQGIQGIQGVAGQDGDDGLGVPLGGATGQVLAKASNADNDTEWVDQSSGGSGLPAGGTAGQIIVKQSATEGDADWQTLSIVGARAYNNTTISIPNATVYPIPLNAESFDTDGIHDVATNNTRFTCKTAGIYSFVGQVEFLSNATGTRLLYIRVNGTKYIGRVIFNASAFSGIPVRIDVSAVYELNVNDYVELCVYQNSGANLDLIYADDYSPVLSMILTSGATVVSGTSGGAGLPSTIIVAASNSSAEDKAIADYVCDGVNDEVQLQSAIDEYSTSSGKILLCNGDYYIDSLQYSGSATYGYFGLMIGQPDIQREIIIEGLNRPTRKNGWTNMVIGGAPIIWLNSTPYNSLGATDLCTILGSVPNVSDGSFIYPGRNLCVKNIGFMLPSNQKKITCISAEFLSSFNWEGVVVSLNLPLASFPYAVEGCIGIQGLNSKMTSVAYFGRESFIYGMWASYVINGEHFVGERLGTRFSIYPYIFGLGRNGVWGDAAGTHPNTLINCKSESCKNGPLFKSAGDYKGTVNFIDYIMEYFPNGKWSQEKFAVEEVIGQWGGLVNYAVSIGEGGDSSGYKNTSGNFWENGHGQNFRTRNIISRLSGATSVRTFMPNFLQEYYDTDYGKMTYAKVTGRQERDTLTITGTATSSGAVTITLNGVSVNISIASGDTPSVIANKIANGTYSGWFSSPTSTGVIFTNRNNGTKIAPSYSAGTTGATGSIVVTQAGTNPSWMDAVGNTVA